MDDEPHFFSNPSYLFAIPMIHFKRHLSSQVPGDNFYGKSSDGNDHLRFAACRSDSDIEEAAKRLILLTEK